MGGSPQFITLLQFWKESPFSWNKKSMLNFFLLLRRYLNNAFCRKYAGLHPDYYNSSKGRSCQFITILRGLKFVIRNKWTVPNKTIQDPTDDKASLELESFLFGCWKFESFLCKVYIRRFLLLFWKSSWDKPDCPVILLFLRQFGEKRHAAREKGTKTQVSWTYEKQLIHLFRW